MGNTEVSRDGVRQNAVRSRPTVTSRPGARSEKFAGFKISELYVNVFE